ncbi:Outer membrane protein assembly factor BamB, contains PQQ-like beta-propeller repeat [Halomicrobium zhouii]|uniref:Outer membrane protein assembly factor BamB, contains PQQ-like beta-propeller repeat n=1 Tax=Halomicrobium zhouii TaxID=767519 RepID=A0A1I6K5X4_9EURY|nr:PQQ-binding-like beta-propeller repeat protein [Halomicrobium zhouii]SFR86544.1 Outer membrane protein assembly factor BamB, contains PQQ-like beta-propeller repeat [Halomicrobium zhouii]
MKRKTRRSFLRNAGLGGTVLLGLGVGPGAGAAESTTGVEWSLADATSDWPTYRGTAARAGFTSAAGPVEAPASRRFAESGPSIDSNLAVADGVAYFVRNRARPSLAAFDLDQETTVWETDVTPGSAAGVTLADDTVYVVGGSQQSPECVPVPPTLAAVDAADGTVEWDHEFDPVTVTWPTVADGRTFVVADDSLVAIDDGGAVAWRTDLADGTAADRTLVPTVADDLVVTADDDGVVAVDQADGSEAWRLDVPDAGRPSIADGSVYATTRHGVVAIDLADGSERWHASGSPSDGSVDPSGAPAVGPDRLYVPVDEEHVAALSTADGSTEWRSDRLGDVSVVGGGQTVYAAVSDPESRQVAVYALDSADGETRWEFEPESPFPVQSPAVTGGALLFGGEALTVLVTE